MNKFEKTSLINCDIEDLFEFHLNTDNLKMISPKNIKVELLNKNFTAQENEILKIRTIKNFIPIYWEVKIVKIDKPYILIDEAVKSPFRYWKHQHIFTQKGKLCQLKDLVEYELPFGKIGNLFNFLVKKELEDMFSYRHKITQKILSDIKIKTIE